MPEQPVVVSLQASGGEVTRREGKLAEFTIGQRVARSGGVLLASVGLAALFLPIPIIHLLAIPMILLGGIGMAIRQLFVIARLAPLRLACPKCGALNRIGGGMGVRSLMPQTRRCDSCRRGLVLTIEPDSDSIRPSR